MAEDNSNPARHPPRRVFPWLAALAAGLLVIALERRCLRQSRELASLEGELARARDALHHRPPLPAPRFSGAAAAPGRREAGRAWVEPATMEHLDGRRADPLYAPYWHKQQRRIIEREYGDALAALGLPAATASRLVDLLTARREAAADAGDIAPKYGLEGPDAKMAVKQSVDALTDQIRQLAGSDSAYGQLESAPQASQFKSVLEDTVAVDLAQAGDPLTSDQLSALARDYVASAYDPAGAPVTVPEQQDQAFLGRAGAYLRPTQVEALKDFLDEERQTLRVSGPEHADEGSGN